MFPNNSLLLGVSSKFTQYIKQENSLLLKEINKSNLDFVDLNIKPGYNIYLKNYLYKNLFYFIKNNKKRQILKLLEDINSTIINDHKINGKSILFFLNYRLLHNDINQAYHPEIQKFNLRKNKDIKIDDIKNIKNALFFLNNNANNYFKFFLKIIKNIVPIDISSTNINKNISFSSKNISSTIFFSGKNLILICESIIHETTHNFLFMIEKFENLYVDKNKIIKTTLRSDKRPISGFFHQHVVLYNLCEFYNLLSNNYTDELILKNKKNIIKRKKLMKKDYFNSKKIYKKNINLFDKKAIKIIEKLNLN